MKLRTRSLSLVTAVVVAIVFSANVSLAGELSETQACVQRGYKLLKNRNAIAAAVLDADTAQTMMFGAAFENEIFEIGSVTKTFTANLLAQSILAGKLRLSDPIPLGYQKPGNTISYQGLTTHTSGIIPGTFPGFNPENPLAPFAGLTIPVFKSLYEKTPLAAPSGTTWSYSNMGTALLGLILSENGAVSYEALVSDKIFKMLGMRDSYFEVPKSESARFPKGRMLDQSGTAQEMPHWDLYETAIDPAGGIRSTIGDMVKYARANLAPEKTPLAEAIELTHRPLYYIRDFQMWIGMNWIIQPDKNLIWHNGETYGFNSIVAVSPKKRQAVVALTDTTVLKTDPQGQQAFDTSLQKVAFDCLK